MGKINILSKAAAEKIAAGEVVERPANAIKEMIENSMDAGAKSITVEIRHGGISYIRITDDGSGILPEDVPKAFMRHATSKIKDETDLEHITTLGFRGEALCSVSSVSKTEIYTKVATEAMGVHFVSEGGETVKNEEAGCPDGTTIVVRDLFYNTPARMKFLKKDSAEAAVITDVCQRQAFSHPDVSLRLIRDGKEVFFTPGNNNLADTVHCLWGREVAQSMGKVDYESDGVRVFGVAGKNHLSRPSRSMELFFVNGRSVINRTLLLALNDAYKNELMTNRFPVAVINVQMNPALCDVNVHPTKTEIKFADDKTVYGAVYWAVKNMLKRESGAREAQASFVRSGESYKLPFTPVKTEQVTIKPNKFKEYVTTPVRDEDIIKKRSDDIRVERPISPLLPQKQIERLSEEERIRIAQKEPQAPLIKNSGLFPQAAARHQNRISAEEREKAEQRESEAFLEKEEIPKEEPLKEEASKAKQPKEEMQKEEMPFSVIGQLFSTYILLQGENELVLMDQHAAHERVRYEEIKSGEKPPLMQFLMFPQEVKLTSEEEQILSDNAQFLRQMGFETEKTSDGCAIKSAPADCYASDADALLCELLEILSGGEQGEISNSRDRAMYTLACRSAIKANHALDDKECELLVKKALALEGISTCPHGRPIFVKLTKYQIEKMFKRIV